MVPLAAGVSSQNGLTPSASVELTRMPTLPRSVLPGDFNGSGHIDLIGSTGAPPANLRIAFGRGDGSFQAPQSLGLAAEPVAVADIDGDGQLDVVARTPEAWVVLPGRGDGTFASPRVVHEQEWDIGLRDFQFAVTADFSGNGHLDLVIPFVDFNSHIRGVLVFPGNGDFTFQAPVTLQLPEGPVSAVAGDFNGDGRTDFAVTQICCSVWLFQSEGGMVFTPFEIAMGSDLSGIATGDLNGDGHLDLVVAQFFDMEMPTLDDFDRGQIGVLLGNGDGTFRLDGQYNSGVRGETHVVLGDFTRDGVLDVATGNRSYSRNDDFGVQTWDSVTIFRGTGTGTLSDPVTFALDTTGRLYDPSPYAATLHQLAAGDLDGDGHPDIISSPGAILLTREAVPNRAPSVSAGEDRTEYWDLPVILEAQASDPDHHWLTYDWRDDTGRTLARWPILPLLGGFSGLDPGEHRFTVTVDDRQGGVASDSVTIISVHQGLEFGWSNQDIGATSAAGSASFDSGTFTVTGSGDDIWGTADAFHYLHHPISGDFRIVARAASVENVDRWTKAGLMIRETLSPGSRHASIFATPTTERPVAFQRRPTTNGHSVHTAGAFVGPPIWLALTRSGDRVTAEYRSSQSDNWITIGTQALSGLSHQLFVGLAVSSHIDGVLATATFDSVLVKLMRGGVPGFTGEDIGAVSAAGSSTMEGHVITVRGSGDDIWGRADAFHYLHQRIGGDFQIVVRATTVENVAGWTKAGLMIREALSPGSRHASVFATPTTERPVAFQRRPTTNGTSVHTAGAFVGPPVWLALTRIGDQITAHYRLSASDDWITIGSQTLGGLSSEVHVGLAVSSHIDGVLATATFDNLRIKVLEPEEPDETGFSSQDVGAVGAAGSSGLDDGVFTVTGSGDDIWGTADAFHYLHRTRSGDFQIVVRAATVENVDRWTKAGLMIRETLSPGSRHASVFATPTTERPVAFQRRPTTNGTSVHTAGAFVGPPVWLALTREGDQITAHYRVSDTDAWVAIGTQTLSGLPSEVHVGFAVSSHMEGVLATATFANFIIEPIGSAFTSQDIGDVSAAGSSELDESRDVAVVTGSGDDIWSTADAFHYLHRTISGDFQVVARAASLENVDRWTKAGPMIRETLAPGSRHASVFATPTTERPVAFQRRPTTNGTSVHTAGAFVGPPVWLALTREGDQITAHYRIANTDDWIAIGTQTLSGLPSEVHVGLAVSSHLDGELATATFDNFHIAELP